MNKNILKEKYNKVQVFFDDISNDHISEFSAQCSYYTILSFIPFVILLITLIQYTNVDQRVLFDFFSKIIPTTMSDMVLGIVQEVYSKSIGTISISIIFTLFTAGKGLFALIKGLNYVYNVKDRKVNSVLYLKILSVIKTIVFIVLITAGLVLLVFGNSLISFIKNNYDLFQNYTNISRIITELGYILGTFIIFLLLYKFMPKHKVTLKSQIPGAIFGAVFFNIISLVFSRYLDIFKGFSITYGSLTTLMLIMIWTYVCFYTVFLGAEINKRI